MAGKSVVTRLESAATVVASGHRGRLRAGDLPAARSRSCSSRRRATHRRRLLRGHGLVDDPAPDREGPGSTPARRRDAVDRDDRTRRTPAHQPRREPLPDSRRRGSGRGPGEPGAVPPPLRRAADGSDRLGDLRAPRHRPAAGSAGLDVVPHHLRHCSRSCAPCWSPTISANYPFFDFATMGVIGTASALARVLAIIAVLGSGVIALDRSPRSWRDPRRIGMWITRIGAARSGLLWWRDHPPRRCGRRPRAGGRCDDGMLGLSRSGRDHPALLERRRGVRRRGSHLSRVRRCAEPGGSERSGDVRGRVRVDDGGRERGRTRDFSADARRRVGGQLAVTRVESSRADDFARRQRRSSRRLCAAMSATCRRRSTATATQCRLARSPGMYSPRGHLRRGTPAPTTGLADLRNRRRAERLVRLAVIAVTLGVVAQRLWCPRRRLPAARVTGPNCDVSNSGTQVDIGAGDHRSRVDVLRRTLIHGNGQISPDPPTSRRSYRRCRRTARLNRCDLPYDVVSPPDVTLADLASFRPARPSLDG